MSALRIVQYFDSVSAQSLSEKLLHSIYTESELKVKIPDNFNHEYLKFILFVLLEDVPLARLAVYENKYITHAGKRVLIIGNFECTDNHFAATRIFKEAAVFATKYAYSFVIGPINGSTWDNYRLPVENEYPLFFSEDQFKNYYIDLFTSNGYKVVTEYYSTLISDLHTIIFNKNKSREKFFIESGFQVRGISKDHFKQDVELIYTFSMQAFSQNYLFSPVSKSYFISKYLPFKDLIDPEYCLLVFDKVGELVCFFFCLPDIRNREEKTLIVKTIAGKPGREYAGLSAWLFQLIIEKAIQHKYTRVINAFMHKNNMSLNISRKFHAEVIRTYQLYIKNMDPL